MTEDQDGELQATEGTLLAFARQQHLLDRVDPESGLTQRDNDTAYFRQTGKHYPGMDPVECPRDVEHLWQYWRSMNRRRTWTAMGGPNPISDEQMLAWQRRRRIVLDRQEEIVIDALEDLYLQVKGQQAKSEAVQRRSEARRGAN